MIPEQARKMNTIRIALINDLDNVIAIVREVTRHMNQQGISQWDEIYPDRTILQKDIENQHMHLIEEDGEVAGMITLNENQEPEYTNVLWIYPSRILVVHRLAVATEHQGKGLASSLMDFAEAKALSKGYDAIRLDAFSLNPIALSLYEHRGYRKAGTVRFRKGLFFCFEKATK
jgi:ribosomal protein S18 acetylase RimI-like enzyme